MSTEIQILEAPIGDSTEAEVREALAAQFPEFRVASVVPKDDKWQVRLERTAEFPLKGLGPDDDDDDKGAPAPDDSADDSDDDDSSEPAEDGADAKPKAKDDDKDSDKPPFLKGDDDADHDHSEDPISRIEHLLRDLQKVIPQLQHILKGDGDSGMDHGMDHDMPPHLDDSADVGPHFPSPHQPPHRPGLPGGGTGPFGGGRGGPGAPMAGPGVSGPPRGALPTFTKTMPLRLTREANCAEVVARQELEQAYPNHTIEEMTLQGNQYVAKLTPKK